MNKLILLVLFLVPFNCAFSQKTPMVEVFTDFSTPNTALEIDTAQTKNLWEIGEPGKTFFNDSHSLPHAICTGLNSNYTLNNYSSFQLTIVSEYFGTGLLEFYHKYDTDKGNAGGYIETSYDNGRSWSNLVNEGNWREGFYEPTDLIFGHTPAFSGKLENWEKVSFNFLWYALVKKYDRWPGGWGLGDNGNPDTLMLRFNFQSNNVAAVKEGWIIDDIRFQVWDIAGSAENVKIKDFNIKYQPTSRQIYIEDSSSAANDYTVNVYDLTGRKVLSVTGSPVSVNALNLKTGMYILTITHENIVMQLDRIIVN